MEIVKKKKKELLTLLLLLVNTLTLSSATSSRALTYKELSSDLSKSKLRLTATTLGTSTFTSSFLAVLARGANFGFAGTALSVLTIILSSDRREIV